MILNEKQLASLESQVREVVIEKEVEVSLNIVDASLLFQTIVDLKRQLAEQGRVSKTVPLSALTDCKCEYCGAPIAACAIGEYCSNDLCGYIDGWYNPPGKVAAYVQEKVQQERNRLFKALHKIAKRDRWFIGGFLGAAEEEIERRE